MAGVEVLRRPPGMGRSSWGAGGGFEVGWWASGGGDAVRDGIDNAEEGAVIRRLIAIPALST